MGSVADAGRCILPAMLCVVLAACQAHAPRRAPVDTAAPATTTDTPAAATSTLIAATAHDHPPRSKAPATATPDATADADADTWQRLRDSFALPGCDYTPGVQHWARRYAASPRRFAGQLAQMLPAIDYTQRQLQAAAIPGEFTLLPIVESHYHPFPAAHAQPAGMWQMIAATARAAGLRIDAWFDGRLNLAASTAAAVVLLDRYAEHFGEDWRLVAFAYNAGEYRVRRALQRHTPDADAASLQGLGMPRTSLEYLDKLLALSCLVREPERFELTLPALPAGQRLEVLQLDGTAGVSLARALSGLPREDFDRLNGGMLKGRTPPGANFDLLLPAHRLHDARRALAGIPAARRLEWRQQPLSSGEQLASVARQNGLQTDTLLALNGLLDADAADGSTDTRFWLPGPGDDAGARHATVDGDGAPVHIVRSGDSLWAIARRHGLTVAELLRYNRMDNTHLRPGQRLRLSAP